ncbi:protein translocase subunit [Massospora cicadina]|nr:protein translocase subunit [Massospora cicadina]
MYRQLLLNANHTRRLARGYNLCGRSGSNSAGGWRPLSSAGGAWASDKSFVGAFIESVRRQVRENKDFKENVKQLQDTSKQLGDSEALRRAKEMFARAKTDVSDSAVARTVNEAMVEVKRYADSAGKTVDEVLNEINENEFVKATRAKMQKVGETLHKSTEPIRNHPVYKTVKSEVESYAEDASRYGGFRDKASRKLVREKLLKRMEAEGARAKLVKENPTAGQSVVLHKDSAWKESWSKFKENSSVVQGLFRLKKSYHESENALVSNLRDFTDTLTEKVAAAFSESEQAKAIKLFRMTVDPSFSIETFLKEARDYLIPEFLDAFVHADQLALKQWCSAGSFSVLKATFDSQLQQGLISDSRVLDLRRVDVHSLKVLEENNDLPVIVVSFETQEVTLFRDKTTKALAYGKEDHIDRVRYVLVLTKLESELDNPLTGGF